MILGYSVELYIYESYCLKDKRRVLKSVLERIKNRFNVSIAETEENELWNKATVEMACVSNSYQQCEKVLDHVIGFMDLDERFEIVKINKDV